ncbi:ABC transporter permease [Hymenobacter sp. 15J16-1T3B]|uniref:ABC transporter permease n=1 Tax=Hymenobacter sp. 15J16-1T3B TaxID=2886941 RepID=UPI001D11F980|nr:ABC transporter permease [Hymenobacter sp. 15J16-1T3B]MCC3156288.1 ABC transporter permease [Hymenobacter sp. 15J16-1T3B]
MKTLRLTFESFRFAWQALQADLLRTILSLLGVTIGIFAIIAVFTVVDSLEASIRQSMSFVGDKVIYVAKWPWAFGGDYPWWKYFNRPSPTMRDFRQLQRVLTPENNRGIALFAARGGNTLKAGSNSVESIALQGVTFDYRKVSDVPIQEGRYFTPQEVEAARNVAVVGYDIAHNLYPVGSAVGREFQTHGRRFVIVGVMEREGKKLIDTPSNDTNCLVPLGAFTKIYALSTGGMGGAQGTIGIKGTDNDPGLLNLEAEVQGAMRNIRGLKPREEDDFALNRPEMLADAITKLFGVIGVAGALIGGLATLVGGFGIANIMFVSVKERTSLIGIQKSLGAKNYFILSQFLFEAVFLCLIGGAAGLFLVWLVTLVPQDSFRIFMTLNRIILGLGLSVLIGIISGIVPAVVAAMMDPVDAIRAK